LFGVEKLYSDALIADSRLMVRLPHFAIFFLQIRVLPASLAGKAALGAHTRREELHLWCCTCGMVSSDGREDIEQG
jgi:hypothetical protein